MKPCTCIKILADDEKRHFKECPRREEHPELDSTQQVLVLLQQAAQIDSRCQVCGGGADPKVRHYDGCALDYCIRGLTRLVETGSCEALSPVMTMPEDVNEDLDYGGAVPCQFCGKHFSGVHVLHVIRGCRGDLLDEVAARKQLQEAKTPAPALMAMRRLADLGVAV